MVPLDDKAIARGYALKEEILVRDNRVLQVNDDYGKRVLVGIVKDRKVDSRRIKD